MMATWTRPAIIRAAPCPFDAITTARESRFNRSFGNLNHSMTSIGMDEFKRENGRQLMIAPDNIRACPW
jgi:hypothetical protein